jgi:hypothetical protein
MKPILVISLLALAGCANQQAANDQWASYQTDLQVIKQFHKYACPECMNRHRSLEGYSKENTVHASASRTVSPIPSPNSLQPSPNSEQVNRQIYDLSQKISILEEALKTNATTTNANQTLLVQQIVALKSQLAQLQSAAPMAVVTPQPQTPSGVRIGN